MSIPFSSGNSISISPGQLFPQFSTPVAWEEMSLSPSCRATHCGPLLAYQSILEGSLATACQQWARDPTRARRSDSGPLVRTFQLNESIFWEQHVITALLAALFPPSGERRPENETQTEGRTEQRDRTVKPSLRSMTEPLDPVLLQFAITLANKFPLLPGPGGVGFCYLQLQGSWCTITLTLLTPVSAPCGTCHHPLCRWFPNLYPL